jgi:hypothetical protein
VDENAGGPRFVGAAVATEHDPPSRHAFSEEPFGLASCEVETDKLNNSLGIRPLVVDGIVGNTEDLLDLILESRELTFARCLHSILLQIRQADSSMMASGQKSPKGRYLSYCQGKIAC